MGGYVKKSFRTVSKIAGPLLFADRVSGAAYGELVTVRLSDGEERTGQVIEIRGEKAVLQVLEGTSGIDAKGASLEPRGEGAVLGVSAGMLGRVFDGFGVPADGLAPIVPELYVDATGAPMNPAARDKPDLFIETGISAIDGLNTLVRGQKLPVFSCAGLPAHELALQIVRQARIAGQGDFCVVLGAIGITAREAGYLRSSLEEAGASSRTVAFINEASEPAIARLFAPRMALAAAEYLAFTKGYHVMVILADMTAYCEALREVAIGREEIPGRRSYPGYMYTDLASIYERAGRLKGRSGSITMMPILTMPDDDITHPIPDLTGYITEGQIVLSRVMQRKGVYPPVDALPCLSRLMNLGIGRGRTREGHRRLADRLYSAYAAGCDARRLAAIVGEDGLAAAERKRLAFAGEFERKFIGQGASSRTIDETLDLGEELLKALEG